MHWQACTHLRISSSYLESMKYLWTKTLQLIKTAEESTTPCEQMFTMMYKSTIKTSVEWQFYLSSIHSQTKVVSKCFVNQKHQQRVFGCWSQHMHWSCCCVMQGTEQGVLAAEWRANTHVSCQCISPTSSSKHSELRTNTGCNADLQQESEAPFDADRAWLHTRINLFPNA